MGNEMRAVIVKQVFDEYIDDTFNKEEFWQEHRTDLMNFCNGCGTYFYLGPKDYQQDVIHVAIGLCLESDSEMEF